MADVHMHAPEPVREAGRQARHASGKARQAATNPWVQRFARFGYLAKGVVYLLLALLVGKAALGVRGGSVTDTKGALVAMYQEPFGKALLAVVALGLLGYAFWNLADAVFNLDHQRDDAKGIATRVGFGALGIGYVGLALAAFGLIAQGNGGKNSDQQAQDWTARLLGLPAGAALVVLVGLVVLGIAATLIYQVWSASFMGSMDESAMGTSSRDGVLWSGRIGLSAMALVTALIGLFLILAAVQRNPGQAKGLGGALAELAHTPPGPFLLGIVALGLLTFGVFSLLQAKYRRVG